MVLVLFGISLESLPFEFGLHVLRTPYGVRSIELDELDAINCQYKHLAESKLRQRHYPLPTNTNWDSLFTPARVPGSLTLARTRPENFRWR